MIAMGPDAHHPLFQQFSLGLQQQFGSNWVMSADGLHVFANRQLNGHLLRSTNSTSPDVECPGNNVPCTLDRPAQRNLRQHHPHRVQGEVLVRRPDLQSPTPAVEAGHIGYQYNISYTLSKTLDYSDDDQLTNSNANEQVNLVEGINQPQLEKGYAVTDELNRITLYGEAQFPWQISFAPIYTFGSGVPPTPSCPARRSTAPVARACPSSRATPSVARSKTAIS